MAISPIGSRSIFPGDYPFAPHRSEAYPQGVWLAQAEGPLPAAPLPKLELLTADDFPRKSVPDHIPAVELVRKIAFYNDQEIDDFLAESQIGFAVTLNGKKIGTLLLEDGLLEAMAEAMVEVLESNLKLKAVSAPGNQRPVILSRTKEFVTANDHTHAAINYCQRVLYLNGRNGPRGTIQITPEAETVLLNKMVVLQDVLYQSYKNVAGRLLQIDPEGLSREKEIVDARLMLATGLTDPKEALQVFIDSRRIKFAEGEGAEEKNQKKVIAKLREDLAQNWYRTAGSPESPPLAAQPSGNIAEAMARAREMSEDQSQNQVEPPPPAPPQADDVERPPPPAAEAPAEAAAEAPAQADAEAAASGSFEVGASSSFSRLFEVWGRGGFLNGNRLWVRPPQLGKRISGGSLDLREEVNGRSLANRSDLESSGLEGGIEVNYHLLSHLLDNFGVPYGSPFILGAFEAGYARIHGEQHLGMFDFHLGAGLNFARLFEAEPDFDIVGRVALLRGGYNNFLGGFFALGPSQFGGCAHFLKKWQACLDYSRLSETGSSGDKDRPGTETRKLNLFLVSLGRFFQL